MEKCQRCRDEKGDYLCKRDVVGIPRKDQEIIGYSQVKEALLRLVRVNLLPKTGQYVRGESDV